MSTIAWRAWEILGGVAAPKFVTRETAVLLILAASLLVFRTLRERCLMVWIVGWLAYFWSHHALISASGQANPFATPIGHGEFVLALGLFTAGAFIYAGANEFLLPLLIVTLGSSDSHFYKEFIGLVQSHYALPWNSHTGFWRWQLFPKFYVFSGREKKLALGSLPPAYCFCTWTGRL